MPEPKKPIRKFRRTFRRKKIQTTEEKIKEFILRNSNNGYFTRVSTLAYKFEIPHSKAWEIVGSLLAENLIEAFHSDSGEMKLCQYGQTYQILNKIKKKEHN